MKRHFQMALFVLFQKYLLKLFLCYLTAHESTELLYLSILLITLSICIPGKSVFLEHPDSNDQTRFESSIMHATASCFQFHQSYINSIKRFKEILHYSTKRSKKWERVSNVNRKSTVSNTQNMKLWWVKFWHWWTLICLFTYGQWRLKREDGKIR